MSTDGSEGEDRRTAILDRIDAVRTFRADLEERLGASSLDLDGLFALIEHDRVVADTKILGLIEALPDVGKVRSRRALEAADIAESALLGETTAEQRARLRVELAGDDPSGSTGAVATP